MDFLRANQWAILGWIGVLLVFVGAHLIARKTAGSITAETEKKETLAYVSDFFRWAWSIFFILTFLGAIWLAVAQSSNYLPHEREDRAPAEQDQKNFERRIQEQQKQNQKKEAQK